MKTAKSHVFKVAPLAALIASSLGTSPVSAEETARPALEEVVVIARQRAEALTDVPATVNVFSESVIEDAGIERASDFAD